MDVLIKAPLFAVVAGLATALVVAAGPADYQAPEPMYVVRAILAFPITAMAWGMVALVVGPIVAVATRPPAPERRGISYLRVAVLGAILGAAIGFAVLPNMLWLI